MADVTKDLLIKISTEGGDSVDAALGNTELSLNSMMGGLLSVNAAWDIFNKVIGVAKTGIGYAMDAMASMVDVSSRFEQLGIRFETVFGGAGPAQKALDWATKFAATTPLTLEQVTERMIKLKTYGFDPMGGMLEKIGDASFALGSDFDGIVTALGQMSTKGKVSSEELNQLAERNIPAIKWLKDEFGLTAKQMENIGNVGLDVDKVINLIVNKMGTTYVGGMKKAGDSWAGSMSTMMDIFDLFQKKIMDNGPWEFLKGNIKAARDIFSGWFESPLGAAWAKELGSTILQYLNYWKGILVDSILPNVGAMVDFGLNIAKHFGVIWNLLIEIGVGVGGPILLALHAVLGVTGEWVEYIGKAINIFGQIAGEFIPALIEGFGSIVGGFNLVMITISGAIANGVADAEQLIINMFVRVATMLKGSVFEDVIGAGAMQSIMGFAANAQQAILLNKAQIAQELAAELDAIAIGNEYFQEMASNMRRGLNDVSNVAGALKIDLDRSGNTEGIYSGMGTGASDGRGTGAAEPTTGRFGTEADAINAKAPMQIQLVAPPGDDMLTLIVKYLNQAIRSEGTIGAGF